jgi:seryl-tRNA synthetase
MLDIKQIRENPSIIDISNQKRGLDKISQKIIQLDLRKREFQKTLQDLQHERNSIAKEMPIIAKTNPDNIENYKNRARQINEEIEKISEEEKIISSELEDILVTTPNILSEDVPLGASENDNLEIFNYGTPKNFSFTPKAHFELGEDLKMMDFEQSAKISGSRFVTLTGMLAKLERAIANFMLDIHTNEFNFNEVSPPLLVRSDSMFGTAQLPKFADDSFQTNTGHWLIPTSEVCVTNLVADKILSKNELPIRYTSYTPCFRSEAGSASKDIKGMIRLHQFYKVELVVISDEENEQAEYENLLNAACTILKKLELPYRAVKLCSADTGFASCYTTDLEVWLPAQNTYREISSCSRFGQFQARRMKARYKEHPQDKETKHVYTMNGSGLAVGRTLLAIMENYQNEDGSITVPKSLVPYMNGIEIIGK